MPKRKKNPTDPLKLAREVVEVAIGEPLTPKPIKRAKRKTQKKRKR